MQSFMEMAYRPGRPNLLTLSKRYVGTLERRPQERRCNMRFEIKAATGVTHLAIEGELDAVSVSELRPDLEKLVKGRPTVVEVDLSSLRMVDSSGVGALVSLYKRVRAQGGSVVIKGLRDQPLAIFRLLRLDRVMLGADTRSPSPAHKQSKSRH